jgi:uncharacterized protein (DUF2062 family)
MMTAHIKRIYDRFLKIRGTPREIALGFALGLFISFTPTMGFQIVLGVFIASLLQWSKISAAIGVQVTNPITAPFIYSATYFMGSKIMGLETPLILTDMSVDALWAMLKQAPGIFAAMTIGGILVGLPSAVIGYFVVYQIMSRYQTKLKNTLLISTRRIKQGIKPGKPRKKKDKTRP